LRQTTAEAVAAQQRFGDLVNSVEGIVWEADASSFQFLFVSKQAERILGYPVQQWLSEATFWRDHLHPEDQEWAMQFCVTATAERRDHDFEYRMLAADGRAVWLRDLATVVVEGDRPTRLRGVMFDITARKKAEAALRDQASLLNLTHDTVFVRDMDSVIRFWNRGAEELYGWKAENAIGQTTHKLLHTEFPVPLEQLNTELLSTGRWEGELIHTKADGTQVVVASRWALQRDERDQPVAILETNNDITEQKRAEEAVRQAQADLTHVSRVTTMGELTASLAHEVNQPIAAAVTNANTSLRWLNRAPPDLEEARQAVSRIAKDVTRASEIISRVRSLFKKAPPEKELVDANELIREMIFLLHNEAMRSSISIRTELAQNLPRITADRVQLQQVFMNLILNGIEAVKAMDLPGEISIHSRSTENGDLLISVSDTGVGLPKEQADQIFSAFFTTKPEGTGLGLTISRSIVESHGGRLWASANAERGTTFHLSLPTKAGA
jgi:PAS domain S-box-containing protein